MQRKEFKCCSIRISLRIHAKKSVYMLRNTHITTCSCHNQCLKVAEYAYHYVFTPRKVSESCDIRISLVIYAKESVVKLQNTDMATWSCERNVSKFRNRHIATFSCQETLNFQEKCLKVAEYAYHYVWLARKMFESCGIQIQLRVEKSL